MIRFIYFIFIAIPLWIIALDVILKYWIYIEWYIKALFKAGV